MDTGLLFQVIKVLWNYTVVTDVQLGVKHRIVHVKTVLRHVDFILILKLCEVPLFPKYCVIHRRNKDQ